MEQGFYHLFGLLCPFIRHFFETTKMFDMDYFSGWFIKGTYKNGGQVPQPIPTSFCSQQNDKPSGIKVNFLSPVANARTFLLD